jgi:type IV fimbrial biogenesis protein FimT
MKTQTGLTLIELMVTLAVAITLMAIGVPMYRTVTANNTAITQTNALVSALNLARSEAVKRSVNVTVCPKNVLDPTDDQCGDNGDWANGWQVFTDSSSGTVGTVDASDTMLRKWEPLSGQPTLTTASDYVRFNNDGSQDAGGEITVSMEQNNTTGNQHRCVRISLTGVIRTHKVTASDTCP